jgi:ParB-like chromosome segregation protein Spo0J
MPQIYDAAKFSKTILKKFGVGSHRATMAMSMLKPSQGEINRERVDSVIADIRSGVISHRNPIVVSSDGYIVDGHHRWAAYKKYDPELKIPVLVVEAPIQDALGVAIAVETKREGF